MKCREIANIAGARDIAASRGGLASRAEILSNLPHHPQSPHNKHAMPLSLILPSPY